MGDDRISRTIPACWSVALVKLRRGDFVLGVFRVRVGVTFTATPFTEHLRQIFT